MGAGMINAPAFFAICVTCSDETRAGSNVTEKSCQPSRAVSTLKSTGS
jgi:hypothetical protein